MSQPLALKIAKHAWENEGGALPGAETSGVIRFLTELYVVDGHAYASLSDASARAGALNDEAEKL